jgi:endonuclease/exonuclease/phosphatase family metal-dependent hydrolase
MRIATYNFCRGGPKDYQTLYRVFQHLTPDILLAQETSNPDTYLAQNAAYWSTSRLPTYHWQKTSHTYWGSAVYTRGGQFLRTITFPDALQGWVAGVDLTGIDYPENRGLPLRMISVHTPTRDHKNYIGELHNIVQAIEVLENDAVLVVGGDFNVTLSTRHPSESRQNVPEEQAVIAHLQERLGLINCWQAANPDRCLDPTFHAGILPTPAFHIDGIFVPRTWQKYLRQCEIISPPQHQWSESDHYPMIADFGLDAEAARVQ